jgi:hypothetical protein
MKRASLWLSLLTIPVLLGAMGQYGVGTRSMGGTVNPCSIYQAYDSFIGTSGTVITSHTSNCGQTWAYYTALDASSGMQLTGSSAVAASATGNNSAYMTSFTPSSANYTVSGTCNVNTTNLSIVVCGIMVRVNSTAASGYELYNLGGQCQLYKRVSGTPTQLGTNFACSWGNGSHHVLTLAVSGSSSTVLASSVDGTPESNISATDSSSPITAAGTVAIRLGNSASNDSISGLSVQ